MLKHVFLFTLDLGATRVVYRPSYASKHSDYCEHYAITSNKKDYLLLLENVKVFQLFRFSTQNSQVGYSYAIGKKVLHSGIMVGMW